MIAFCISAVVYERSLYEPALSTEFTHHTGYFPCEIRINISYKVVIYFKPIPKLRKDYVLIVSNLVHIK